MLLLLTILAAGATDLVNKDSQSYEVVASQAAGTSAGSFTIQAGEKRTHVCGSSYSGPCEVTVSGVGSKTADDADTLVITGGKLKKRNDNPVAR